VHTVGVDLGDRKSAVCRLDADGEVVERRTISTTGEFFEAYFRALPKARVVMEVGTHSLESAVCSRSRWRQRRRRNTRKRY
jgi:hypothetical protein